MGGILYPLQLLFWPEANPVSNVVFIVGVSLLVGIFIFVNIIKNKGKLDNMARNGAGKSEHPTLRRLARSAALNKDQTNMLAFVLKNDEVTDPEESFNSPEQMDRHFKNAYRVITDSGSKPAGTADTQDRLALFFSTRNMLEARDTGTADGAGHAKRPSQRMFPRRQTALSADFYLVRLEDAENRKKKKLAADKEKMTGTITDISIGGCGIQTTSSIASSLRLKIEFSPTPAFKAVVLGQVLRTNKTGSTAVLHIKFLKVPRRSMNAINALVFGYSDR
jgi:hypothetical protein